MTDFGITAFGAYVPRLRIERRLIADAHKWMAPSLGSLAKGSRSFANWDEDAITMAVEAARDALTGENRSKVGALHFASTTMPYADLQNASIVASALGLERNLRCTDVTGSQRAGTLALLQALQAGEDAIVVVSDAQPGKPASLQELAYGAGAAAIRVGSEGLLARLIGAGSLTSPFVDHFRSASERYDYFWEERWIREEGFLKFVPEAVNQALAKSKIDIGSIDHFILPSLQRGGAEAVAKKIGFAGKIASGLENGVGYAGAAHGLLMLSHVLEGAKAGERILLASFGQGADALLFEVTEAITNVPARRSVGGSIADALPTDSYMRLLSFAGGIDLEWGMRAEKAVKTPLTEQYRSVDQMAAFVAGKCAVCGCVQFPRLEYCVKCQAPAAQFEGMSLADESAKVLTSTADWLSYHPAPPLYVGFVQFDNGARVLMEMVDVGPQGVEAGTPLRMVFRIKERDRARGFNRYFWKSTPISV